MNEFLTIYLIETLGVLAASSVEWWHNVYNALLYGAAAAVVAAIAISIMGDLGEKEKEKKKKP